MEQEAIGRVVGRLRSIVGLSTIPHRHCRMLAMGTGHQGDGRSRFVQVGDDPQTPR